MYGTDTEYISTITKIVFLVLTLLRKIAVKTSLCVAQYFLLHTLKSGQKGLSLLGQGGAASTVSARRERFTSSRSGWGVPVS